MAWLTELEGLRVRPITLRLLGNNGIVSRRLGALKFVYIILENILFMLFCFLKCVKYFQRPTNQT